MATYERKPEGVRYHPSYGLIMEHKGHALRIHWSAQMTDYLRRHFSTTLNEDLAEWLGVSLRTMIRKARELGLEKDKDWLRRIWEERRLMAHMSARRKGYPGCFKKGERANPAGEFKPGHKPTEEQRAKKSASMKRWYRLHPAEARAKARKAWETRRKLTINNSQL